MHFFLFSIFFVDICSILYGENIMAYVTLEKNVVDTR